MFARERVAIAAHASHTRVVAALYAMLKRMPFSCCLIRRDTRQRAPRFLFIDAASLRLSETPDLRRFDFRCHRRHAHFPMLITPPPTRHISEIDAARRLCFSGISCLIGLY